MLASIGEHALLKKNRTYLYIVCTCATLGEFLFGFDTAISGTISPVKKDFNLDVVTQSRFVSSALLGCIVSFSFSGKLSDKYGRKIVLFISALLFGEIFTNAISEKAMEMV